MGFQIYLCRIVGLIFCLSNLSTYAITQPLVENSGLDSLEWQNNFKRFLQFKSLSGNEFEAGNQLLSWGKQAGLSGECLNCTDTSINISLSLYPLHAQKPNIILLSHLDVVPAYDSIEWKFPPFAGTIADSTFFGRGAIDAKGLTFMHLLGLLQFKKEIENRELPFNVTVLSVCGEETGGFRGAKVLSDCFLETLRPWVVYGEGGSGLSQIVPSKPNKAIFGIAVSEKVNLWLRLDLKFNSFGHGAAPPNSYVNKDMLKALHKLNQVEGRIEFNGTTKRMFRQLGHLEGGFKGWIIRHLHWWLWRPIVRKMVNQEPVFGAMLQNTAVLTNIFNPPGPPNQISNRATVFMDCRLLPQTRIRKFIREIKYGLIEPRFKVSIINQCPEAEESSPELPEYMAFAKAIEDVFPGSATMPILFPASSDNNYFRQFGIPTYGITPVMLNRQGIESIHGLNESLAIKDLWKGASVFKVLLQKLKCETPKLYFQPINSR